MDPLKLPPFVAFTKRKIFCRKFSSVYPCRLFSFSNTQLRSLRDKDILKFAGECIYYAKNSDAIKGNEKQRILRIPSCLLVQF